MKITLEIPDDFVERIVRDIMENFPEASRGCTLACVGYNYEALRFTFEDNETGKEYKIGREDLIKAFPLIYSEKWPDGCTKPPTDKLNEWGTWDEWLCQCDATDHDAFSQLACLGEVIYG